MIRILVDPAPIDIAAEMALAEAGPDDGGAGAVATFTGLVRTDDGVDTLELEHYPGATEAALIEHARAHLAPFKLPKRVIFRDDLPRNTAGKLLKRELRAHYAAAPPPPDGVPDTGAPDTGAFGAVAHAR